MAAHIHSHTHTQFLLLRWLVNPLIASPPRTSLLVQHHMGCDQEGGREVQLLHRSPANPAPFLACARHQLLHVRVDIRSRERPRTIGMASSRRRLGGHLPARGGSRQPHPIPHRSQPVVDDFLLLIMRSLCLQETVGYVCHSLHAMDRFEKKKKKRKQTKFRDSFWRYCFCFSLHRPHLFSLTTLSAYTLYRITHLPFCF
jgi:hypothetical protein